MGNFQCRLPCGNHDEQNQNPLTAISKLLQKWSFDSLVGDEVIRDEKGLISIIYPSESVVSEAIHVSKSKWRAYVSEQHQSHVD